MSDHRNEHTHPAYGFARFCRTEGGARRLFMSSVKSNSTIKLEIGQADRYDGFGEQKFHTHCRPLIEVEFTPAQFAELLTTMNVYNGAPCTIRYRNGESTGELPDDKLAVEEAHDYFKEGLNSMSEKATKLINEAEEMLSQKGGINVAKKKELATILLKLGQDVHSNMPFYAKQFDKVTNKVVTQAKAEIDSFVSMIVEKTGWEALKKNPPQILLNKSDKE